MVDLLTEVAHITGSGGQKNAASEALDRLLREIELHVRLGKLDKLDLGLAWKTAAESVRSRVAEPVTSFPDVDLALLEHGKSRSGFVGVYFANGKFRAIVPDPAQGMGAKTLEGRSTALESAVDRYRWHQTHGLPYGNLGWHIDKHREQHPEKSIDEALLWAHDLVSSGTFGLKNPFTLDQVLATQRARRKQSGLPIEATPAPSLAEPVAPAKVFCAECKDEIVEGEPFVPHSSGSSAWAHAGCV